MRGGGGRGGSESIIASFFKKFKKEKVEDRRWQMSIESLRWRYVGREGGCLFLGRNLRNAWWGEGYLLLARKLGDSSGRQARDRCRSHQRISAI